MNPIAKILLDRGAQADAAASVHSGEDRIKTVLGERPRLDPVANAEHAKVVRDLDISELEELREDLRRADEEASQHVSPAVTLFGLLAAVLVEVVGAVLILRAVGVPTPERLPLAFALAVAIIGITAAAARFASSASPKSETPDGSVASTSPRNWKAAVVLVVYTVFVIAVVIVRMASGDYGDEEGSFTFAHAIILAATAIGPAWAVEAIVRRRRPSLRLRSRVRALRERVRDGERRHRQAETYVRENARAQEVWDQQIARRRAAYATAHRLASARSGGPDDKTP